MNRYRREHPEEHGIQGVTRRYLHGLERIMGYFGVTVEQVAHAIGMSRKAVSDLRSGSRKAKYPEILTLCSIFGCTEDDLYGILIPEKAKMALWDVKWELLDGTDEK